MTHTTEQLETIVAQQYKYNFVCNNYGDLKFGHPTLDYQIAKFSFQPIFWPYSILSIIYSLYELAIYLDSVCIDTVLT